MLIFSSTSFALTIVSDLDDTIKITNSGSLESTVNAVFTNRVFTGMPEFFHGASEYSSALHILSASPTILRGKIERSLESHHIDFESVILKNPLRSGSKFNYKVEKIKELMKGSSEEFIFLGDDVNQDPESYDAIKKLHPDRVRAIYIHQIRNRALPVSATPYWTSFDLTLREVMAGRMRPIWLDRLSQALHAEKKMWDIFPSFAECPSDSNTWSWEFTTPYKEMAMTLDKRFITYCQVRQSGN